MKKIKYCIIFLSIILLKLLLTFSINEIIIHNFKNNINNQNLIKTLYIFNFNEPYIVYYNNGNILYKLAQYDEAINKYNLALKKNPPQKRICDIRINLSLSMIKKIDSSNPNNAYTKLEEAKNNLYENNCANPIDSSGYSQKAETLEEQINELERKLQNESDDNQPKDDNEQDEPNNDDDYETIEEQLKEIEKNANSNRQSDMNDYENMDNFEYYSGKKW